jgi:ribosomal protein L37E
MKPEAKAFFENRKLVIATMHKKEQVIAPVLESALGVQCMVPQSFDTDVLGTFTGEVQRPYDPLTTARKKCLMAMQAANCDMAVASEGSFGPHPDIPFVPAGEEWLFFMDTKNRLEVYARHLTTATNFGSATVKTLTELDAFAYRVGFPQHALILRTGHDVSAELVKGINRWDVLEITFNKMWQRHGQVFVETDMRAMYNPTRMAAIEQAANQLVSKIVITCPACGTPGFGIVDASLGLPCRQCGTPTRSVLSYTHRCLHCGFSKTDMYPNKKQYQDPMFCDNCNP